MTEIEVECILKMVFFFFMWWCVFLYIFIPIPQNINKISQKQHLLLVLRKRFTKQYKRTCIFTSKVHLDREELVSVSMYLFTWSLWTMDTTFSKLEWDEALNMNVRPYVHVSDDIQYKQLATDTNKTFDRKN